MADIIYAERIGDGRPDGTCVFRSSAEVGSAEALGAFFGATPIARPSGSGQASVSTAAITSVSTAAISSVSTAAITSVATAAVASSAGVYGFATAAAGDGVIAAVNALITRASALTTEGNAVLASAVELQAAANSLVTRAGVNTTLVNQLRSDLSSANLNLIKGGA